MSNGSECMPDFGRKSGGVGYGGEPRRVPLPSPTISDPWLASINPLLPRVGRYWYLASKMSGLPGFNYPEFDRIAAVLRDLDYTIVSPAEFEHESHRKRIAEANGDEDHDEIGTPWVDCLARDVAVVANPRCLGIIVFGPWHDSRGALLETQVADSLGKPIYEFTEDPNTLRLIGGGWDREEALADYERMTMLNIEGWRSA